MGPRRDGPQLGPRPTERPRPRHAAGAQAAALSTGALIPRRLKGFRGARSPARQLPAKCARSPANCPFELADPTCGMGRGERLGACAECTRAVMTGDEPSSEDDLPMHPRAPAYEARLIRLERELPVFDPRAWASRSQEPGQDAGLLPLSDVTLPSACSGAVRSKGPCAHAASVSPRRTAPRRHRHLSLHQLGAVDHLHSLSVCPQR
jgi:hypothetical protein